MKHVRFISGSLLVQTGPESFLHLNITNSPARDGAAKPLVNASIVGRPSTQDDLRRIVEVVLEQLDELERADVEPRRIVVPG